MRSIDFCRVQMYWAIGRRISEKEQQRQLRERNTALRRAKSLLLGPRVHRTRCKHPHYLVSQEGRAHAPAWERASGARRFSVQAAVLRNQLTGIALHPLIAAEWMLKCTSHSGMKCTVCLWLYQIKETRENKLRQLMSENRSCPYCGRLLRIRNGNKGIFWGCSGYPSCKYTEGINLEWVLIILWRYKKNLKCIITFWCRKVYYYNICQEVLLVSVPQVFRVSHIYPTSL